MKIANDLQPYLRSRRGSRGKDMLSVEKQLALTLYYLKDQGSLAMTANSFSVALCSVSVVVQKVCDRKFGARMLRSMYTSYRGRQR